nr:TetR family transcriptional regulator C-terminal domain-containing protein [Garicola koreensis]
MARPATADPIVPKLVLEAMLQAHRDPEVGAELARVDDDEMRGLRVLLSRAVQAGEADPALDADDAAAWISALVSAVYLQTALAPDFDAAQQLANLTRTVRAFLREA